MAMEQERLEYVERALEDLRQDGRELCESVRHLDTKVDGFRSELSARIDALDKKVDASRLELSARIDALDKKVDASRVELSARIESLDQKVGALGAKIDGQFKWIVGLQFGFAVTIVGAVVGALYAIR